MVRVEVINASTPLDFFSIAGRTTDMTVRTHLPWDQLMTTSTLDKYLEKRAEWQPPRDVPSEPYPVEIPEFPPDEKPLPESPQEEPPGPDETPPRPPPENGRRLSGAGEKPLSLEAVLEMSQTPEGASPGIQRVTTGVSRAYMKAS